MNGATPDARAYPPVQSKEIELMMIWPLVRRLLMVRTLLPVALPTKVFVKESEAGDEEMSVVCAAAKDGKTISAERSNNADK